MRSYLEVVDVQSLIDNRITCKEKPTMLERIVSTGMSILLPMKSRTIIVNEPPWVNRNLKKDDPRSPKSPNEGRHGHLPIAQESG